MPGYDPRCANCHRCGKCNGDGSLIVPRYDRNWKGETVRIDERQTCPSCNGRGGSVGVGRHDHR